MGTGKTTLGRALALRRGVAFLDLDEEITRVRGKSIPQIFQENGEATFRKWESEALIQALDRGDREPVVVSVGGGALVDRETRLLAVERCVVVTLMASPEEIGRRTREQEGEQGARPLLSGSSPEDKIRSLLALRKEAYAEAHAEVQTENRALSELVEEVGQIWDRDAVLVPASEQSYLVQIGAGLMQERLGRLVGSPSGVLLVTDSNVNPLYGDRARAALPAPAHTVVLTPGEQHKNLEGLAQIFQGAFDASLDRKATFVGLGGGVATDMTGFAASSWVRGVRWVALPTTLLSMVDASVGGKTGVDFATAKNSVGAFWQPAGVICDISTLRTETDRAFLGALSEVVKTALIGDPDLLDLLEQHSDLVREREPALMAQIVERCVRVKARIVARDERETSIRATLNLGHTIGHALESSGGYTALTHGEAVSLGLVAALRLGQKRGHTSADLCARVLGLLKKLGLPHKLSAEDLRKSTGLLGHDKKRAGDQVRFVYARKAGDVFTEMLSLAELERMAPELAG